MNKKLIVACGIMASVSFGFIAMGNTCAMVKADDETSEPTSSENTDTSDNSSDSEDVLPISSEDTETTNSSFYDSLSQTAKDVIAVLQQPLVIGGVSLSLGTILLAVISKLVSNVGQKKLKGALQDISDILEQLKDIKSYNDLTKALNAENVSKIANIQSVLQLVVENVKNQKVKEECLELLQELEPVKESATTFVKTEGEKVKADTQVEIDKDTQSIIEIINKE